MKAAKVISNTNLTDDVFELVLETEENFEFIAGQFVTFKIDDQVPPCFRAYSISSVPKEGNRFEVCVKVVEGGRGSNWLHGLKEGDSINFIGPNGKFVIEDRSKGLFFIATGTGVAPFKSMIEDELNNGNQNPINILFGLRHASGVFYKDLFREWQNIHNNFNHTITLSRCESDDWDGEKGRVTAHLENMAGEELQKNNFFICGLKAMIDQVVEILKAKGVPEEQIHFEKFD